MKKKPRLLLIMVLAIVSLGLLFLYMNRSVVGPDKNETNDLRSVANTEGPAKEHLTELIRNWRHVPDKTSVVRAIEAAGELEDALAIPALAECVEFVAPISNPDKNPALTEFMLDRKPGEEHPAMPAIIERGKSALPYLIPALTKSARTRRHEYYLLSAFAAIAGPQRGIECLDRAIELERIPAKQARLREVRERFLRIGYVPNWLIGKDQPFVGTIYEASAEIPDGDLNISKSNFLKPNILNSNIFE